MCRSKGVCLILLWILLFHITDPSVVQDINNGYNIHATIYIVIPISLFLLLPFINLIADLKIGGFCCHLISVLISYLITSVYIVYNILEFNGTASKILIYFVGPLYALIRNSFSVYMLLYGADQIPNGSSSQYSSLIWWYNWCEYAGLLVIAILTCTFDSLFSRSHTLLYATVIHLFSLSIIFVTSLLLRKWIKTDSGVKNNPVKLIINVLRFAKNNTNPLKRSAFTYWSDSSVSRLDNGKKMFGGPFEEDEVESVKTFFRLIPLLFCINLLFFSTNPLGRVAIQTQNTIECLTKSTFFVEYVIILLCILIKQLMLKKSSWTISIGMLSKLGLGILLVLLSRVSYLVLDLYVENSNATCILDSDIINGTATYNDNYNSFLLLPLIVGGFGALICIPTSVEFIFAQCPYNMRALMIGMLYCGNQIAASVGWGTLNLFGYVHNTTPGCIFYKYLADILVLSCCFGLFFCIKKYYKLRIRRTIFSPYNAADLYYTKLLQERTSSSSSSDDSN